MRNAEAAGVQTAREMHDRDWFTGVSSEEGGSPGVEGEGPEADACAFGEGPCAGGNFVVTLAGNELAEGFDGVGVVEEGVRVAGGVEGAGVEGGEEGLLGPGGKEDGGRHGGRGELIFGCFGW